MLEEPKCWTRNCKHFLGVTQPDGTEETEVVYCKAFPDGIPEEIAYGDDPHDKILLGQTGRFVYEEGEPREFAEAIEEE